MPKAAKLSLREAQTRGLVPRTEIAMRERAKRRKQLRQKTRLLAPPRAYKMDPKLQSLPSMDGNGAARQRERTQGMIDRIKELETNQQQARQLVLYLEEVANDPAEPAGIRERCAAAVSDYWERHPYEGLLPGRDDLALPGPAVTSRIEREAMLAEIRRRRERRMS